MIHSIHPFGGRGFVSTLNERMNESKHHTFSLIPNLQYVQTCTNVLMNMNLIFILWQKQQFKECLLYYTCFIFSFPLIKDPTEISNWVFVDLFIVGSTTHYTACTRSSFFPIWENRSNYNLFKMMSVTNTRYRYCRVYIP